ncbi:hypothetical protein [Frigoriflavimonas asaccharolytica]|uniref:Uncharacterized protein n=1 Tax=Frigoriflavimonas asaccharolytica TaxID=2735899 RepID=A0A8J8G7P0_9FLAO|nr:hypothetical protein [Frigoriflavimonas asaccharolytica]NRS92195.1 hypothetical protein [Frigoriflavimonas asaccharolytica]
MILIKKIWPILLIIGILLILFTVGKIYETKFFSKKINSLIMKLLIKKGIDPNRIMIKKGKTASGNATTTFKLIDK